MSVLFLYGPITVFGMGLGEGELRSYLGQQLNLRIQVRSDPGDELTAACFGLGRDAPGADRNGVPILRGITLVLERDDNAVFLRARSASPIYEPVVRLLLETNCIGGVRLVREYVLLLDPPRPDTRIEPRTPEVAPSPPVTAQISPPSREKPVGGIKTWFTQRGDTLWGIAKEIYPGDYRKQRRLIREIVRVNPESFPGGDPNRFYSGVRLMIPALPPVRSFIAKPVSLRIGSAMPAARLDQKPAKVPAPSFELKLTQRVSGASQLERDTKELMLDVEEQYARGDELRQRIKEMEERVRLVQGTIKSLDSQIAVATQSVPTNAVPAPEVPVPKVIRVLDAIPAVSEERPMQVALVALAVVALFLLVYFVYGRRFSRAVESDSVEFDLDELAPMIKPIDITQVNASDQLAADYLVAVLAQDARQLDIPIAKVDRGHPVDREAATELLMEAETEVFFGRTQAAIKLLQHHIDDVTGYKQHAAVWLMLFRIYRRNDLQRDFLILAKKFKELFNIQPPNWDQAEGWQKRPAWHGLEQDFPRILESIITLWGSSECTDLLNRLLVDGRGGEREGFILPVAEDLLLLKGVLDVRGE